MTQPVTPCAETRQALHLLLGGELEPEPQRRAEEHLAACPACRAELTDARRSRELYLAAAVDADAEPLDLWPDIRVRLRAEGLLSAGTRPETPVLPLRRRWLPVAAAAAAAVVLALPFLNGPRPVDAPADDSVVAVPELRPIDRTPLADTAAVVPVRSTPGLRTILRGDESLLEREQRLLREQRSATEPGGLDAQGGLIPHPLEPSLYDVVGERRLR